MFKNKLFSVTAFLAVSNVQAAEVAPGDYEQFPAGATIGVVYYNHATTDKLYSGGHTVSSDFNVTSNVGIARLLHVYQITDHLVVDPQFLLPFGKVSTSADASVLGSGSGVGDLILTAPLKYRLNEEKDTASINAYLYVPTGSYDKDDALNLGENRWKVDYQAAYVTHFGDKYALDMVGDVIWYGDNNSYGSKSSRLEQDTSYSLQLMGRYILTPQTNIAVGFGHNWGGNTEIDGVSQHNRQETTNFRLTATTFIAPKDQLQIQLGKDLSVENGPAEDFRLNLRLAHIF
jgi:hypothetical protein